MNKIFKSKNVLMLVLILTSITFGVTLLSNYFVYRTSIHSVKKALLDIVNGEKLLIEALYQRGMEKDSILSIIRKANSTVQSIGESGELVIAELDNDSIHFIFRNDIKGNIYNVKIFNNNEYTAPIRLAVLGNEGSMKGKDYSGTEVFAGYTYFKPLKWGIVAKINSSEVNQPFYNTIMIAFAIAIILIFFGSLLFLKITNPMIDSIIQSEKNLSLTLKSIGDGVITTDENGFITSMNPIAEKLCAWEESKAKGKPLGEVFKLINAATRKSVDNSVKLVIEKSTEINFGNHTILVSKDGKEYQISNNAAPIQDSFGNVLGVVLVFADKTEKYASLDAIRDSENFLKETQKIAKLGTYTLDIIGGKWISSEILDLIFGIDSNFERTINNWLSIIHPEWQKIMSDHFMDEVIGKKQKFNKEYMVIRQNDGKERWVHGLGELKFNDVGEPILMVGTITDITERKLIEQALQDSEEKFRTLFSSMTEMVALHELVFDDKGVAINYKIIDCNNAYTSITGIKKEIAVGNLATDVYQVEQAPYLDEFTKVALSGNPYEYTTYFQPMDKHFAISVVSPMKNQFATITTDITAIKQIQELISTKNKELENYLFIASHDLRSPLVNIQGFSQRLKKQADSIQTEISNSQLDIDTKSSIEKITNEGIPKTLSFIFNNVAKMDSLINGLLQISRTGREVMTIRQIDMNSLFVSIINANKFQLTELSADVNVHNLSNCYGDQNLLNQLFANLLTNAIKYRNKERKLVIEISSKVKFNKIIYTFKDNGIGIADKHLEKIWDVFYRVNAQSEESGDGLGLSIVKRIVDKHRGQIWVASEEGVGSVFNIELPKNEFSE